MEKTKRKFSTKEIVCMGMFCALAYAVMALSKLIPVSIAGFLNFDFKDFVIAICGFLFGPLPAIIVTVIVSLIEMITISSTGPIGLLMNVLSTCAFVVPAALFYRSKRKFSSAVVGLILGIVCMAIIMVLWNWLITPLYMGVPRETVVGMLLPVFLPFNLIKGAINAASTLLLYHPIVSALRKANLVPQSTSKAPKKKGLSLGVTLVSIFVIISLVLVILAWTGII